MKRIETVRIPKTLNISGCINAVRTIRGLGEADEYVFDFEGVGWVSPFAMLFLSSEIRRCIDRYPTAIFGVTNHLHMTYAGYMGFFKAFRLDFGNHPGQATGSKNYVPITLFNCQKLRTEASEAYEEVGQTIESKSKELARMLTQADGGNIVDTLTFSLREVMRNAVEHSESKQFGVCAQYWPSLKTVEVGLLDRGIGIRNTLSKNHRLTINSDRDALHLSLMPGVSGKAFGKVGKKKGVWENSGFGLYMTSRLCRNGGNFFIASGEWGLNLRSTTKRDIAIPFKGTALCLSIRTENLGELNKTLERFRKEGFEIASKFGNGALVTASSASQMLSRDFTRK